MQTEAACKGSRAQTNVDSGRIAHMWQRTNLRTACLEHQRKKHLDSDLSAQCCGARQRTGSTSYSVPRISPISHLSKCFFTCHVHVRRNLTKISAFVFHGSVLFFTHSLVRGMLSAPMPGGKTSNRSQPTAYYYEQSYGYQT